MATYLVRHGETVWNQEGRKQGRGDSALTSRGELQAINCAGTINQATNKSHRVLMSPLGRAQQTANIICDVLTLPPKNKHTADELAELDYGLWQGLTDDEIDRVYPGERIKRYKKHWDYQIPEGESYAMVDRRISSWLRQQDLSFTIIVAHEMVNRVILGIYQGLSKTETLKLNHPHGIVYELKEKSVSVLQFNI